MNWESFVACLGACGVIFGIWQGIRSWTRSREQDNEEDGRENGMLLTEIGYVKSGIDDIKRKQERQESQYIEVISRITAVEVSAKQAHHRIDRIEGKAAR